MSAEHVRQELGGGRAWRAPHPVDRRSHPLDTSSAGAIVEVVSTAAGATDVIAGDTSQLLLSGECPPVVDLGPRASPGASTPMPGDAPPPPRTAPPHRPPPHPPPTPTPPPHPNTPPH